MIKRLTVFVVHPGISRSVNALIRCNVPCHVRALLDEKSRQNKGDDTEDDTQNSGEKVISIEQIAYCPTRCGVQSDLSDKGSERRESESEDSRGIRLIIRLSVVTSAALLSVAVSPRYQCSSDPCSRELN
jgi:hypothetical protein